VAWPIAQFVIKIFLENAIPVMMDIFFFPTRSAKKLALLRIVKHASKEILKNV